MNQEHRDGLPAYLTDFPYVNGGLFADKLPIPKFNRKSRAMLIECGSDLNWSEINPDIFGSMIQAVVHPDQRGNMGMHYTSVPNIMKVIEPLFLNELKEEFEKHADNKNKLELLLLRLEHLKIFDPACGSGNFLIIAYKELRQLEMEIFKRLQEISKEGLIPLSRIRLSQFYGIELDDFAHEVAILSLWLAEHQMNMKFKAIFGHCNPALPLKSGGNIFQGNATRLDWSDVCHCSDSDEVFILGNPPYKGSKVQDKNQKSDMKFVFDGEKNFKDLDYISCWFFKASAYLSKFNKNSCSYAFVTTNSICQGSQVSMLWPMISGMSQEIGFCYGSFKWGNNAKNKAGVTVTIIGVRKISNVKKYIFSDGVVSIAKNINFYLTDAPNIVIPRRSKPISKLPKMDLGNMPIDGGNLILSEAEKDSLVNEYPDSKKFIKKLYGTNEFIKGLVRWCIWIENTDLHSAMNIPPIKKRIEDVKAIRENSSDAGTKKLAARPHQFREMKSAKNHLLLVSRVSSERRDYIPMGIFDKECIVADAQVVYDPEIYLFGLLSSKLNTVWVKATSGCLESRIRYSSAISYNNFPVPLLTKTQIDLLSAKSLEILSLRENYPEKTIGDLYDPEKMPDDLLCAHQDLDEIVESCYRAKPFSNDEERLEHLFKLYEKMTGTQNA